jgi:hypothetical protein
MEQNIQIFNYQDQGVQFYISPKMVMVNATEMAKIFDADVNEFTRNDGTKKFMQECLKTENSRFLAIEKDEDLIVSKQKSGTLMHRVLALKFAAWLSPAFELWVFVTIDKIVRGRWDPLEEVNRQIDLMQERIDAFELKYSVDNAEFGNYLNDKTQLNKLKIKRSKLAMGSTADLFSNN